MSETASARAPAPAWPLMIAAATILLITTGARQSLGLYIAPLNESTGLGIADISLALAVGQFVWGASQPLFGAIADRYGPVRVILAGAAILAIGFATTPLAHTTTGLIWTLGVLSAAGAGAGSFSILIGAAAQRLAPQQRAFAAGFINAGASFGQFVFAPLNQLLIVVYGWVSAISTMALLMLATAPLAWWLRSTPAAGSPQPGAAAAGGQAPALQQQLSIAARDPSYWYLHLGFFTCGFHVAFLVTHLPGEVNLCGLGSAVAATSLAIIGLANIAGSLGVGVLGNRVRLKWLLFWVYFARAVAIALYLASPRSALTFYLFAGVLGLTWLSTVPPTAGLVGKLFGTRYLATLFGLTLLSHQIGGFFGAFLGGQTMSRFGNYSWMWYADILLALSAALINLPIREQRLPRLIVVR
ncbi:MAG TPA: MFS transporter [Burkholderiaceae bacterium]|nr:MFS transporter [Burkholderiaceae bacterium]